MKLQWQVTKQSNSKLRYYMYPDPAWKTDPKAALRAIEEGLDEDGSFWASNGHFAALRELPRNIHLMKGDQLQLDATNISNISGIECLQELKSFKPNNLISDFTPLTHLPKLERLTLSPYSNWNLTHLSEIKNLKLLELWVSQSVELKAISNLQKLEHLTVHGCDQITLPRDAAVRSLSIWAHKAKLDVMPLQEWRQLEYVHVNAERVISDIPRIPTLKELHLTAQGSIDLRVLENSELLTELKIYKAHCYSISSLAKLNKLRCLTLCCPDLSDLKVLIGCETLEELDVSGTNVSDLSPALRMKKLRKLNVSDTPVMEIVDLSYHPKLEDLYASRTQIKALNQLPSTEKNGLLSRFWSANSKIKKWNPRSRWRNLHLGFTEIDDVQPLKGSSISRLSLNHTKVKTLAGIETIKDLYELNADGSMLETLYFVLASPTLPQASYDERDGGGVSFNETPLSRNNSQMQKLAARSHSSLKSRMIAMGI